MMLSISTSIRPEKLKSLPGICEREEAFFPPRESYGDGLEEGHNKKYNRTQVYRCLDDMHDALPRFLIDRENFSEELPDARPLWGNSGEDELLRKGLESRKELSQDIVSGKI
jgi:hypothetical protein